MQRRPYRQLSQSAFLQEICTEHARVNHVNIRAASAMEVPSAVGTLPGYPPEELARLQTEDEAISRFLVFWRCGTRPRVNLVKSETRATRALLKRWDRIQELHVHTQDPVEGESHQMLIKKRFYWPGMAGDVETWRRKCERCTVAKAPVPTVQPAMGSYLQNTPLKSWLRISQCWNEQLMARPSKRET